MHTAMHSEMQCGPACWLKEAFYYSTDTQEEFGSVYSALNEPHRTESDLRDRAKKLYEPLHSWQTRIVELHPGKGDDELKCTLLVADLIAQPGVGIPARSVAKEYVALSYSWGRPALTASIECNGIDHGISPTLHEALWYMRREEPLCNRRLLCSTPGLPISL